MTRPIELYQGEDMTLTVEMNDDISAATEIELYIDTNPQVKKTLSAGQISGVTSTQFDVQIDAGDTNDIPPGAYKYQARATLSSKKYNIKFTPNTLNIRRSIFENPVGRDDYVFYD